MGPAVLLFVVIGLIPFFYEIWYSFTNWDGIHANYQFVGLKNYIDVLTNDPKYWHAMWFTIKFAFCIVGGVVLGFLWRFIITELFPVIGEATGIGWFSQSWFQTEASSFWAMVIVMTWSMAGYMMIIYVAGLTSISSDYVEAATIDGAKSSHVLRYIILPLLMPSVTQCLFLSMVNSLKVYDLNISLTNGNPFRLSEAVTMNVYQTAFSSNLMGYGSAKALLLVLVIAGVSLIQVAITSSKEVEL